MGALNGDSALSTETLSNVRHDVGERERRVDGWFRGFVLELELTSLPFYIDPKTVVDVDQIQKITSDAAAGGVDLHYHAKSRWASVIVVCVQIPCYSGRTARVFLDNSILRQIHHLYLSLCKMD